MRFAILGCGVIGGQHAKLVTALGAAATLAAVSDVDTARAAALAGQYGVDAVDGLDKLLARDDVDTITVCLPSGMHADATVAALEAGKHVVVEKPIDITLPAAGRILAAERRTGRHVAVISQRRFEPQIRALHDAIGDGVLGRVTSVAVDMPMWRSQEYYDSGGWRGTWKLDGGGALMNQGVHFVDLMLWLGGEVTEVTAYAECLAHDRIEVEDTVTATVRFGSGALGTLYATTAAYPGMPLRIRVHGDRGCAVIDSERLDYFHSKELAADQDADQSAALLARYPHEADPVSGHRAQLADFVTAVRDGRVPAVTSADGYRALAFIIAVYTSAREGRPVRPAGLPEFAR